MRTDQVVLLISVLAAAVAIVSVIARIRARTQEIPADHTRLIALAKEWRAPAELVARSTPRDVRYTKSARVMFAILGVGIMGFATVGVLLIPGMRRAMQDNELVRREGVAIDGIITGRRTTHGKNESYHVTYAYEVGNRRFTSDARVARRDYGRLTIGAKAIVHYAPSRPELSQLDGADRDPPQLRMLIFLPILFLLIAPFSAMRLRKLLAWGTPTGAIITRVSPTKGGKAIRYQFLDPNGEVVTGSDVVPSPGAVKAGDVITVVFDPDRPRRKARYPMPMVMVGE
jgi:hypothetical protein